MSFSSWFQLFSDTSSLYTQPADPSQMDSQTVTSVTEKNQQTSPWSRTDEHEHLVPLHLQLSTSPHPELLYSNHYTSCLFGAEDTEANYRLNLSCQSFSSQEVYLQKSWASSQRAEDKGSEEVRLHGWRSRAGAVGRVVERTNEEWTLGAQTNKPSEFPLCLHMTDNSPITLDPSFSSSPVPQQPANSQMSTSYHGLHPTDRHHISYSLSPPTEATLWAQHQSSNDLFSSSSAPTSASSNYGSKCWTGRERKRSEEAAGLGKTGE